MRFVDGRLSLLFESDSSLDAIDPLWTEVVGALDHAAPRLSTETLDRFRTVLVEAVVNAIVHGHREDGRPLQVEVHLESGRLEARVHDSGPGFVFSTVDLAPMDAEHGRGLFLMRHMSDEARYRQNPLGNTMHLALAVTAPPLGEPS